MTTERISNVLNKEEFWAAKPFPHLVLDDFLPNDLAEDVLHVFPSKKDFTWTPYLHFNEQKYGLTKQDVFPAQIKQLIDWLNSESFCQQLAEILGVEKLLPDPLIVGGGLHQTFRNGFLNIHTDFSHHPHNRSWKRKLNLLLYLNKDWPDSYEGKLELWDKSTQKCEKEIEPVFNRVVIFLTDSNSLHGSPKRLKCTKIESRKSIAFYYYEKISNDEIPFQATTYFSAAAKPWTRWIIESENLLLRLFSHFRFLFKLRH